MLIEKDELMSTDDWDSEALLLCFQGKTSLMFFFQDDKRSKPKKKKLKDLAAENSSIAVDNIPVAEIDLNVPLHVPGEYLGHSLKTSRAFFHEFV